MYMGFVRKLDLTGLRQERALLMIYLTSVAKEGAVWQGDLIKI